MQKNVSGLITLITDFGLFDPYVGMLKGVILSINPVAGIVDVTHQVGQYDISGAAYVIGSSFFYFPSGTVHVVVVDPGVGGSRRILSLKAGGHIFVAPDNGVLSRVIEKEPRISGVWVENWEWFLHPISRTFHGRDIFAPVSAYLSMGRDMADLGPALDPGSIFLLPPDLPEHTASGGVSGRVIRVDSFGNLVTNISADFFRATFGDSAEKYAVIRMAGHEINGISKTYGMAAHNALLAVFGSAGFIEISVNLGSAADYFKVGLGAEVFVDAAKDA